jgi:hypothetical protein
MDDLVRQLTLCIETGDFENAFVLLARYRDQIEADLLKTRDRIQSEQLITEAIRQNNRWFALAVAMRSHVSEQLRNTMGQSQYLGPRDEGSIHCFIG